MLAAEGLCGLGRGERRESGVQLLPAPLQWQVMVPRHPGGGLGNARVKGRSEGLWPKAQPHAS